MTTNIKVSIRLPNSVRCYKDYPRSKAKYVCVEEMLSELGGERLIGMFNSLVTGNGIIFLENDKGATIKIDSLKFDKMTCEGKILGTLSCTVNP